MYVGYETQMSANKNKNQNISNLNKKSVVKLLL